MRLAIVTRRFWPIAGGTERAIASLATELAARGVAVTVVTVQWEAGWPSRIDYRGVQVLRLPRRGKGFLGTRRWLRNLSLHMRDKARSYDAVYVCGIRQDCHVVLKAIRRWGIVVVLRAEGSGETGDCLWQLESAGGRKIKRLAMRADAFVGPTEISHRELIAAGYPRDRIHRIVGGVAVPGPVDPSVKLAARSALEGVNTLLHCPPKTPVAVYTGSLDEWTGPATAIDAWRLVTVRWPSARLWLVGAEANQSQLNRRIEKAGLTGRVVIPGVFADVTELLAAADVAIIGDDLPESLSLLLEAMAAGLPVAAADRPEHRSVLNDGTLARLYPPGGSDVLGRILVDLCDDADKASCMGTAARAYVEQRCSVGKVADDHLRLLENLVRQGRKPSQS